MRLTRGSTRPSIHTLGPPRTDPLLLTQVVLPGERLGAIRTLEGGLARVLPRVVH